MFQATRRRLALWYTAVTAALLLLFATGVYLYVRSTLIERVDDTLNHVVEVVTRSLVIESTEASSNSNKFRLNLEATFPDNAETLEDDHIDIEWFNPTGELLFSTLSEPLKVPVSPNYTGETVHLSTGQLLRQVTQRVQIGRQVVGYLRVSHPWFEVTKPIRQLILDLCIGITFMVICVAAIGWLLSGMAIQPIRDSYQRLKQFTSDASHELRNPIAMIQTNVQVALADSETLPTLHQQQLQVVERLTRRLGRLVDDLLFLARQDSNIVQVRLVPVPFDALLMDVLEEQQLLATSKGIKLSVDIVEALIEATPEREEDAFTLQGDWDHLARLLTNLISNAIQYTPEGGAVLVHLQEIKRQNSFYVQIKVTDTGIGIPEEALPYLFDRFYRVDSARSHQTMAGSGLGLAIAAAIVENHQGYIEVESTLNQGTTVSVTLPC